MSEEFELEKNANIAKQGRDSKLVADSRKWFVDASTHKYPYNFTWLGRPIIQFPQDIVAMQEIVWHVKPDLIIETGIAHGGSLIFYASILELLGGDGEVLGIDIEIRKHNRIEIERHSMFKRIKMIEGSSIDTATLKKAFEIAEAKRKVMVVLDSNHTHDHVLSELQLYSPLVTVGSYIVVFDTMVEHMPPGFYSNRPWGIGNNPKTAVLEFLKTNNRFEIDKPIQDKLLITSAPDGYLKCVKD